MSAPRHTVRVGVAALLAVVVAISCGQPGSSRFVGEDDYAVYAAIAPELFGPMMPSGGAARRLLLVTSTLTNAPPLSQGWLMNGHQTPTAIASLREASDNLRSRSKRSFLLKRFAGLPANCPLATRAELDSVFRAQEGDPTVFHSRYPNIMGYACVSCVGFSKDRRSAIVWTTVDSGGTTALYHYLLSRQGRSWRVDDETGGVLCS